MHNIYIYIYIYSACLSVCCCWLSHVFVTPAGQRVLITRGGFLWLFTDSEDSCFENVRMDFAPPATASSSKT